MDVWSPTRQNWNLLWDEVCANGSGDRASQHFNPDVAFLQKRNIFFHLQAYILPTSFRTDLEILLRGTHDRDRALGECWKENARSLEVTVWVAMWSDNGLNGLNENFSNSVSSVRGEFHSQHPLHLTRDKTKDKSGPQWMHAKQMPTTEMNILKHLLSGSLNSEAGACPSCYHVSPRRSADVSNHLPKVSDPGSDVS